MRKDTTKKARENYIDSYYRAICDGEIVVGRWIFALYEYIERGLSEKLFFYDESKAYSAIEWIEAHCFHTEGKLAPGNLKLELWQKALLSCLYGILDENGNRQFRECVLIVASDWSSDVCSSDLSDEPNVIINNVSLFQLWSHDKNP